MKKYLIIALACYALHAEGMTPQVGNPLNELKARVANKELFYTFEVDGVREFLNNHPDLKNDFADWVIDNSGYLVDKAEKVSVAHFPPRDEVNVATSGLLLIDIIMSWGDSYAKKIESLAIYSRICDLVTKYFRGPDPIVKRYNLNLKNDAQKNAFSSAKGCALLSPATNFTTPTVSKDQGGQR